MSESIPLIYPWHADVGIVWRNGIAIRQRQFLQDVFTLAESLPDSRYVFNLCHDRYLFMVTFCAALIRDKINLLPPNRQEAMILELSDEYDDCAYVSDKPGSFAHLPCLNPELVFTKQTVTDVWEVPTIAGDQCAAIPFTSGSTGRPTPNYKPWRTLVGTGRKLAQRFQLLNTHATIVATVPSQHMYGLEMTVMMALQGGCIMNAAHPFYPDDIFSALQQSPRPAVLVTTPVHMRALIGANGKSVAIDHVVSATAKLAPELAAQVEDLLQCPVEEIYGCTEAGSMSTRRTVSDDGWHMLDGMWLSEEQGQFYAHGDQLSDRALLQDQLELYDSRRFNLLGRSSDMIILAGKRSSLSELTQRIIDIPEVEDAVVFLPQRDNNDESRPAAAVVTSLSPIELKKKIQAVIDPVFLPRPLRIIGEIKRNETGKVTRTTLDQLMATRRDG